MSNDALTDGAETDPTQAQPAPETTAASAQTAEDTKGSAEEEFSPEELPENKREAFKKWADRYASESLRKQQNATGNALQRLSPEAREKLKKNPAYLDELEAERDALRRAVASSNVGPANGHAAPKQEEEIEDYEADAKRVLIANGYTPQQEGWDRLMAFEVEHLKVAEERAKRILKKSAPQVPNEDQLLEKLTEKQRAAQMKADWDDITASDEWNDPVKGPEYEGRLRRKAAEEAASGRFFSLKKISESVLQDMNPKKPTPQARVSMGSTSSGKVAGGGSADPWRAFNEDCKAKGIDPEKF